MSFPERVTLRFDLVEGAFLSELLAGLGPDWDTRPEAIQFFTNAKSWYIEISERMDLYSARLHKHIEELEALEKEKEKRDTQPVIKLCTAAEEMGQFWRRCNLEVGHSGWHKDERGKWRLKIEG